MCFSFYRLLKAILDQTRAERFCVLCVVWMHCQMEYGFVFCL